MVEYHFTIFDYSSSAGRPLLIGIIFCVALSVFLLVKMIVDIFRKRKAFPTMPIGKKLSLFIPMLSIMYLAFFLAAYIWPTWKYSMYLPFEKEEDSVSLCGQIDRIMPVQNSPRYTIGDDSENRFASIVTIDGEGFYFLTAEGLKEGTTVEINYLPRSHMVLDCVSNAAIEIAEEPAPSAEEQSQEERSPLLYIIATIVLCILIAAMIVYIIIMKRRIKRRKITG